MDICVINTLKSTIYIRDAYTQIKFSKKNIVVGDKTPHSVYLNIGFFDWKFLHGTVALSIVVLSAKKQYSRILKDALVFRKTCFKVQVLKTFKIFSDCFP